MTNPPPSTSLTELEGATLATIKKAGECTPYFVRDIYRRSKSSDWSGSSGAIYPLITRLEKRGLLQASEGYTGKRKRILYSLSARGEVELQIWLLDIERGANLGFDPMRTRLFFHQLYGKNELTNYVAEMLNHMMANLPAPENDDLKMAKVHQVWLEQRKITIEKIMQILES
jgi:DNA-binding PadR family transcriptional regulator